MTFEKLKQDITLSAKLMTPQSKEIAQCYQSVLNEYVRRQHEPKVCPEALITEIALARLDKVRKLYDSLRDPKYQLHIKILQTCVIMPQLTEEELLKLFNDLWKRDLMPSFDEFLVFVKQFEWHHRLPYSVFKKVWDQIERNRDEADQG